MTFIVSGKKVRTPKGAEVKLPCPVRQSLETAGMLIVVLDVPVSKDYPRNVLAIDDQGRTAWQIAQVPTTVHHGCFVGVLRNGDWVRARHFDGWEYDLDPVTGRIVGKEFLK